MTDVHGDRTIPGLVSSLVSQLTHLMRTESELARAEISEGIGRMGTALMLVVAGAVLLIPALVILLSAAVSALIENGMSGSIAALLVGGVVLLVGIVLVFAGMKSLKPNRLIPNRTLGQLSRDAEVAKNQMRTRHDLQRAA
ncbi:MAG: phage holin family protein [Gemmatimonas sp.]